MKTTLRLELPALSMLHASSRVAFALLDRQHAVQRTGELPLAELAAAVPPSRVEAILHPADSVLTTVTVPPLPTHRLQAAVAGAVEPMLLGDIESLAVAHGARTGDGAVAVAWTARDPLARALRLLADNGLPADVLMPAPLALPLTETGWTVLVRDDHVVVRTGLQTGQAWAIDPFATTDADPAVAALLPALEQDTPGVVGWIDPPPAGWPNSRIPNAAPARHRSLAGRHPGLVARPGRSAAAPHRPFAVAPAGPLGRGRGRRLAAGPERPCLAVGPRGSRPAPTHDRPGQGGLPGHSRRAGPAAPGRTAARLAAGRGR